MSRCVMISSCGDPLLGMFCLNLLKKNCWDEIDRVYIHVNNYAETPKEFQTEFLAQLVDDPKIKFIYSPVAQGYGLPFTELTKICTEDLIMLLEDDGFILSPGKVGQAFSRIESGEVDALGSPRFSCGSEIAESLRVKYNLDYTGVGDKGPTFWPNFFFCKRADLLKTDLNFAPKVFEKRVFYPELDHTMVEEESGDTFVWMSVQLRALGLKIGEIPQFHSSPFEIEEFERKEGKWAEGKPYWLHGGSLSVGASKYLKDAIPDVSNDSAKQEIESRVAWWTIIGHLGGGFAEYRLNYLNGIAKLTGRTLLDVDRIYKKIEMYKNLV